MLIWIHWNYCLKLILICNVTKFGLIFMHLYFIYSTYTKLNIFNVFPYHLSINYHTSRNKIYLILLLLSHLIFNYIVKFDFSNEHFQSFAQVDIRFQSAVMRFAWRLVFILILVWSAKIYHLEVISDRFCYFDDCLGVLLFDINVSSKNKVKYVWENDELLWCFKQMKDVVHLRR